MTWLNFFTALLGGLTSLLIGAPLILWWAMRWLDDEMEAFASLNARPPYKYDPTAAQAPSHPQAKPHSTYETAPQSSIRAAPYDGYPYPYRDYD